MPLLARNIRNPGLWTDGEDHWSGGDFPFSALTELADGRSQGLSLYEVNSVRDPALGRIAAALWLGTEQNTVRQYQFRFVHTDQLDKIGITYEKTSGKLPFDHLNTKHYQITGLDGPKSIELARSFFRRVKQVGPDLMLFHVARELHGGGIDISVIKDKAWPEFRRRKALVIKQTALKKIGRA
jgi:hypothetical protein